MMDKKFKYMHVAFHHLGSQDLFVRMLVTSFVLHVTVYLVLLSLHGKVEKWGQIGYLELKDLTFPAEIRHNELPAGATITTNSDRTIKMSREAPHSHTERSLESEKAQPDNQQTLPDAATNPVAPEQSSLGLGLANGYFSSLAEGENLRPDIREYYFNMLRVINEQWWVSRPDKIERNREAIINVVIDRNGVIVAKEFLKRSGNPLFDRTMLHSLDSANPLPPLPKTYEPDYFSAPLRFIAPLNLLVS